MKHLLHIFLIFILISCQIEDDNAPTPDEAFIKYYGELTSYEASDIEIIYDATGEMAQGLIVLGSKLSEFGDTDFFVLITDLNGTILDSASFELRNDIPDDDDPSSSNIQDFPEIRSNDVGGQIHRLTNGNYAFSGTSSYTQNSAGISDFRLGRLAIITPELSLVSDTFLTVTDDSYGLDIIANDVIQLRDESLLIVGAREFSRGPGITDFNNYLVKLDLNGGVVFDITQGISGEGEDDLLVAAFEKADDNLALIGYSNKPSDRGENEGNNGTNVLYLETDANGTPIISSAYGLDDSSNDIFNEEVNNVIKTTSGFVIAGTSSTSQNDQYAFIMNITNSGVLVSANNHINSAFNSQSSVLQTIGMGVTQALNNDLILVGQYTSFTSGGFSRGGEGLFVKFDQGSNPIEGAESFFGLSDGNEIMVDAVTLPDGKIVALANVDFGGGVKLISIIKLNDDGSLD
jgi:hypothetical protein